MFRINHENYFNTFINIMKTEKNMKKMITDCTGQLRKEKTAKYIIDLIKTISNNIEDWEDESVPEFLKYLGTTTDNSRFIKALDRELEKYLAVFKCLSVQPAEGDLTGAEGDGSNTM